MQNREVYIMSGNASPPGVYYFYTYKSSRLRYFWGTPKCLVVLGAQRSDVFKTYSSVCSIPMYIIIVTKQRPEVYTIPRDTAPRFIYVWGAQPPPTPHGQTLPLCGPVGLWALKIVAFPLELQYVSITELQALP